MRKSILVLFLTLLFFLLILIPRNSTLTPKTNYQTTATKIATVSPKELPTITGKKFGEILEKNSDIKNLLSFQGLNNGKDINYPIAQEQKVGEYFYGSHDYKKDYNELGTIFKPALPKGLENDFELLLGHRADGYNSKEPLMFSHLPEQFKTKDSKGPKSKTIYYTELIPKEYKAVMALDLNSRDMLYTLPYKKGTEEYKNLLKHLNKTSNWKTEELKEDDNLLILSTCQVEKPDTNRFVVILKELK